MPNHYDTCRKGYCPVCGQTLNSNTGECLSECTKPGGTHYIPPQQKKKDLKKLRKIIKESKELGQIEKNIIVSKE